MRHPAHSSNTRLSGILEARYRDRWLTAYVKFGIQHEALYQLMFTASLTPDWQPEAVIAAGVETQGILEDVIRNGAAKSSFFPALTRKANLQTAWLQAWSAAHGLTMLAIHGVTNVEEGAFERVTDKVLTVMLDGMGKRDESAE